MFSDADHEVIDSPEALFRHLYEEHGVEEALDLDPETAPPQFWLRRHAELERAQRADRRPPGQPPDPPSPPSAPHPEAERRAAPRSQPERPEPGPRPQPAGAGREGRRPAGFGDPLVEAMARALAGRGHDEAAVRSAIRSFAEPGRGPAGEAAVRTVFVEPMLQSVAERLLGAPRSQRPAPRPQTAPAAAASRPPVTPPPQAPPPEPPRSRATPPASPPAREEPVRPEAAWAGLWADLADTGRRPGDGPGTAGDDGDDLMAVANAVQARRRVRLLRR
jgi:hypothetical protein